VPEAAPESPVQVGPFEQVGWRRLAYAWGSKVGAYRRLEGAVAFHEGLHAAHGQSPTMAIEQSVPRVSKAVFRVLQQRPSPTGIARRIAAGSPNGRYALDYVRCRTPAAPLLAWYVAQVVAENKARIRHARRSCTAAP
jgi:hypothetical protein